MLFQIENPNVWGVVLALCCVGDLIGFGIFHLVGIC